MSGRTNETPTESVRVRWVHVMLVALGVAGLTIGFTGTRIPLGFAHVASPVAVFGGALLVLGGLYGMSRAARTVPGRRFARTTLVWTIGIAIAALAATGSVFIVAVNAWEQADVAAVVLSISLWIAACAGLGFGLIVLTRRRNL